MKLIVPKIEIDALTKQQEFEWLELRGFDHTRVIVLRERDGHYVYEQERKK